MFQFPAFASLTYFIQLTIASSLNSLRSSMSVQRALADASISKSYPPACLCRGPWLMQASASLKLFNDEAGFPHSDTSGSKHV